MGHIVTVSCSSPILQSHTPVQSHVPVSHPTRKSVQRLETPKINVQVVQHVESKLGMCGSDNLELLRTMSPEAAEQVHVFRHTICTALFKTGI